MENHNNRINCRVYEENLSVFGRNVYKILVQRWKTNQNRFRSSQHGSGSQSLTRKMKVIAFVNEDSSPSVQEPMTREDISNDNNTCDEYCNTLDLCDHNINAKTNIPTSSQLMQTVIATDPRDLHTCEIINPVIYGRVINTSLMTGTHHQNVYCSSVQENKIIENRGDRDVDWDDMFDSELLSPYEIPNEIENVTAKQNERIICKAKTKNNANNIKTKHFKKNSIEIKNSFRKQKYTKTVKNWLNNVHTDGCEESLIQSDIVIEKDKEKNNKKVVQAQLANKDGKMKYKKPNVTKSPETEQANSSESADENRKEKLSKTTKPKFIAPIKSQLPVREIQYQVLTVDTNNMTSCRAQLKTIINREVIAILLYRNGFSQLNKQYTEEKCEAVGFILLGDDKFFHFKEDSDMELETIHSIFEMNSIICYEGKHLLSYIKRKFDMDVFNMKMVDTQIGGSLLAPDEPPTSFSGLQKLVRHSAEYTIATQCALQKAAWYATLLRECSASLAELLRQEQLWSVFIDIEMKLLPILADMELQGVSVDLKKLKAMEDIILSKMKSTEAECHKVAGRAFQITSPAQVRAIVYDELQLDTKCNVKIRETLAQGAKSTSEDMLRGLAQAHPLPRLVLQYRHLHKARATFLAGVAHHVRDDALFPTWVQTAAATGRIACHSPNLQAIPKAPFVLDLFPGGEPSDAQEDERATLNFRSIYVARAGCALLACDFKQVECRVFAHHAADDALRTALAAPGDLFTLLAHQWLQKPTSAVSSEERERTKRIVYAALYGAGVKKLQDILQVSYEQALTVHASFTRTFPCLKSFGSSVVSACAAAGGRLASLCGRVRRFPHISSEDPARRAQAQRQAVNFIIQGSAADLCKLAMVAASAALRAHHPPLRARLLLQIHDELVWEVDREQLHTATGIIKRAMEECGVQSGMRVPLPVAVSAGATWGDMTPYDLL